MSFNLVILLLSFDSVVLDQPDILTTDVYGEPWVDEFS